VRERDRSLDERAVKFSSELVPFKVASMGRVVASRRCYLTGLLLDRVANRVGVRLSR
jgi:hypothetical protein